MPRDSPHRLWLTIATIELVLLLLCAREIARGPDGRTHLSLLDVGQGDALLLTSPSGKQVLVDGGPDAAVVTQLPERMPLLDRTIELLVLTHPDLDHVGGLPEVLRRYRVERVLLTGVPKDTARYKEFLSLVKMEGAAIIPANPSVDIDMGDGLVLDVVWPHTEWVGKDVNNASIVIRAFHGGRSALLTGDIEDKTERAILASGEGIDADFLKAAHHGSRTSSGTGFLLAVSPEEIVISVAKANSYGHPHPSVLERYEWLKIPWRSTAELGIVDVVF